MLKDPTQDEDCAAPIAKRLSSLWLRAGTEEMAFGVGVSRQGTGHTAVTN
jgi:hypothetical protein